MKETIFRIFDNLEHWSPIVCHIEMQVTSKFLQGLNQKSLLSFLKEAVYYKRFQVSHINGLKSTVIKNQISVSLIFLFKIRLQFYCFLHTYFQCKIVAVCFWKKKRSLLSVLWVSQRRDYILRPLRHWNRLKELSLTVVWFIVWPVIVS